MYSMYTEDRSSEDLCSEWALNVDINHGRFFTVDAEANHINQEFTSFLALKF